MIDPAYAHEDPKPSDEDMELSIAFAELHAGTQDHIDIARLLAKVRQDEKRQVAQRYELVGIEEYRAIKAIANAIVNSGDRRDETMVNLAERILGL